MIICPGCSSENEDHYKFCLACGTELSREKPAPPEKAEVPKRELSTGERKPRLSGLQERLDAIREYRESVSPKGVPAEADLVGQRASTGWTRPPSKGPQPMAPSDSFPSLASKITRTVDAHDAETETGDEPAVSPTTKDDAAVGQSGDTPSEAAPAVDVVEAQTGQASMVGEVSSPSVAPASASAKPEPVIDSASSGVASDGVSVEPALSESATDIAPQGDGVVVDEANDFGDSVDVVVPDEHPVVDSDAADTDLQATLAIQDALVKGVTQLEADVDHTVIDGANVAAAANELADQDDQQAGSESATVVQPALDTPAEADEERLETQIEAPPAALRDALSRFPSDHERYQVAADERPAVAEDGLSDLADGQTPAEPAIEPEEAGQPSIPAQGESVRTAPKRTCAHCGADVPKSFKFCGACGKEFVEASVDAVTSKAVAELILIHPDGSEGEHFSLRDGNIIIGRDSPVSLFSNDPFLSPRHAKFGYANGWLTIQDLDSYNGVFIRLRAEVRLNAGDYFRLGQQLLTFENSRGVVDAARPTEDGTMVGGSPSSGIWGRIRQVYATDTFLGEWTLTTPEIYIGRERGTITFTSDIFISSSHCRLRRGDGFAYLADLGSTNGTYVKLKDETALSSGDLILLGQQLFRVHIMADES
ncbi:MAG: FHA domain-containing protein [Myxococcota bacterium]|nr:FHA domain-containing protein [Myxococcota bacterium]